MRCTVITVFKYSVRYLPSPFFLSEWNILHSVPGTNSGQKRR